MHLEYSLAGALGIRIGDVVGLVGGGGKTSTMFRLAHELTASGQRVITTTTTRILPPEPEESRCVIVEDDEDKLVVRTQAMLQQHCHVTLGREISVGKLKGLFPETVDRLAYLKLAGFIIIEADGASRQPLKAPNDTEPVIPAATSLVVALVGADCLAKPLSDQIAFRVDRISKITGLGAGELITIQSVATLLTHPNGIIQHSPASARIVPFINKVTRDEIREAKELAEEILKRNHPQIKRVVFGSVIIPQSPITVVTRCQSE
jgi:probable selenium-dependent hydroxylase accessory protein YqeC